MAVWIMASDYATYRSLDAFRALEEVNWSEAPNAHIAPGDVVYLYITKPISAIGVKCYVTSVGLPEPEIDDREFWVDEQRLLERINGRTWMRLKRVAVFSDEQRALLKGAVLERYGLRGGFVQSRQRATVELLDYIESVEQGRMIVGDDAVAEAADFDPDQVAQFKGQIARDDYAVPDETANAKTRGSAQRAFADTVKSNYNGQCAITGISTREFLVASHIVPWSEAPEFRLDPRNGICLSTLVDRAFDAGFLQIGTDYVVRIDWTKIVGDAVLGDALKSFDGRRLTMPERHAPHPEYLRRRLQSSPTQAL